MVIVFEFIPFSGQGVIRELKLSSQMTFRHKFRRHPRRHPNGLFSGDYISVLRGCCALKFLRTLEIDKGLLHTPEKGQGPPPKKKSWKLKICLKIQRARVHNFRNSGSIFTKLFHATCHYCERNFVFLKLILHSDLRCRAASRLALPCPSSFYMFYCFATDIGELKMYKVD